LDQLSINTIRFLFVDAVQKANTGHPGLPLEAQMIVSDTLAASPQQPGILSNTELKEIP
jgi:transketolase